MDITEDLVSGLVKQVTGGYETTFHTQTGEEYQVVCIIVMFDPVLVN